MKPIGRLVFVLGLMALLGGCSRAAKDEAAPQYKNIRGLTAGGKYYPQSAEKLNQLLDECFQQAKKIQESSHGEPIENLRALVCPHADPRCSGITAAIAYMQVAGRDIHRVIIMGPTHTARFKGAMIPLYDAYETPLGYVPVSALAADLAEVSPFSANPEAKVFRPEKWETAPKELPPFGSETPDTWEHSVEVQLPFLQRMMDHFEFVPIILGDVEPADAAKSLIDSLDDRTLLVASSDLSHFSTYADANYRDRLCVEEICNLETEKIEDGDACGRLPIKTVMEIARKKGWKAKLLDYRNSGDTTEEKRRVVGYTAIAFYEPPAKEAAPSEPKSINQPEFSKEDSKFLLKLARDSVNAAVSGYAPPMVDSSGLAEKFVGQRASFVTLKNHGVLRGCVGSILPVEALYLDVIHRARDAVLEDGRFKDKRIKKEELKDIDVEISVLTVPERVYHFSPEDLLTILKPGMHGVILVVGRNQATYLPQVWEDYPDKIKFLDTLSMKAQLDARAWTRPDTVVLIYRDEAFKESEN
jgi:MEMO1 family protein